MLWGSDLSARSGHGQMLLAPVCHLAFRAALIRAAGLTDAGKALVKACDQMNILLDVSHLNEAGFWDIARLSQQPLLASHSNAHALCPSPRNLTDRQLDAVAESGGLVGVCFATAYLRSDGRKDSATDIELVIRQLAYLVNRMGEDHVGLGLILTARFCQMISLTAANCQFS